MFNLKRVSTCVLVVALLAIGQQYSAQDLWTSARQGDMETLKVLVKNAENIDVQEPNFGFTPLMAAVIGNQPKAVKLLLKNGADVNKIGMGGNTALHAAAFLGYDEIVKALLKAGANAIAANEQSQVPSASLEIDWTTTENIAAMLQLSISREELEAGREKSKKLLDKELDKLSKNDIWLATTMNKIDNVKRLAKKADVNEPGQDGATTLISTAAALGYAEITEILIRHGALVNSRSPDGATPLVAAALFGHIDTVKVLLEHGADTSIATNDGTTPLAAAQTDMQMVDYVASLFNITLDYDKAIEGKREAAKLLESR